MILREMSSLGFKKNAVYILMKIALSPIQKLLWENEYLNIRYSDAQTKQTFPCFFFSLISLK